MVCCLELSVQSGRLAVLSTGPHRGSRGCYHCGLSFGAVSSIHFLAWCFQICTTSTFTFGQFSDVGLLAILTDVSPFVDKLCKRQYLCSRRSEHMPFEHSSPFTFSAIHLTPSSRTFLFSWPEVLVCLLHHCVYCERATHVVCKLWTVVCGTAAVSSLAAIKGEEEWN